MTRFARDLFGFALVTCPLMTGLVLIAYGIGLVSSGGIALGLAVGGIGGHMVRVAAWIAEDL